MVWRSNGEGHVRGNILRGSEAVREKAFLLLVKVRGAYSVGRLFFSWFGETNREKKEEIFFLGC